MPACGVDVLWLDLLQANTLHAELPSTLKAKPQIPLQLGTALLLSDMLPSCEKVAG